VPPAKGCSLKPFDIEGHYKTHFEEYDCYNGESRKWTLAFLKSKREKQTNMFKHSGESDKITITPYKISYLLGCHTKPNSDGKIMNQAIATRLLQILVPLAMTVKLKNESSNDTVTRQVDRI